MKVLFFALACLLSSFVHAEECPKSASEEISSYFQKPAFQSAFAAQVEFFSGFKVKKLEFREPDYAGDSHSGLYQSFVPSGLARIGEGRDVMNDVAFRTDNGSRSSLVLQSEGHELSASFRFDDWTLCQGGQIVQPWVSIQGSVEEGENSFWIDYIWDYEKNLVIGPSAEKSLIGCFAEGQEGASMPFVSDFGLAVLPTAEHGRYFLNLGLGEQGSFALPNCKLTTNNSLTCEGEEVHSATLTWLGLVDGKLDAIELEIFGRNSAGAREVLSKKTRFVCK